MIHERIKPSEEKADGEKPMMRFRNHLLMDIFGEKRFKSAFFGHFPLYECSGPLMLHN
tara:strand:+ start:69 stop:242 length:174 start_codon:yes stop_codon:yes gene_type:complete